MLNQMPYKRHAHDAYNTPSWCTEALIESIEIPKTCRIWEPAAGDGAIVATLKQHNFNVLATDIQTGLDFVTVAPEDQLYAGTTAIITNPPYHIADRFIRQALRLMALRHGLVAMLLRNEFDCAQKRADLFSNCLHFDTKLVLTRRPRWIAGSTGSPRHNYAWFIWRLSASEKIANIKWFLA